MNQEEINIDEAQVGRILHVTMKKNGRSICRPAIVYNDDFEEVGTIDVKVFIAGSTSDLTKLRPNHTEKETLTWHWPRECKSMVVPSA